MKKILLALFIIVSAASADAQCENTIDYCKSNFSNEFISDGQVYKALLYNDQIAEFDISLFGGNTYRISCGSGEGGGNLVFRLYDKEKNLLFSNQDYTNAPFWDFVLESTIDCTIEAQLDLNRVESGCGVLLIGFKE